MENGQYPSSTNDPYEDALSKGWDNGYADGLADERGAVIRYLVQLKYVPVEVAEQIESGEHRK